MRRVSLATRARSNDLGAVVGVLGCMLALAVGAAASTDRGVLVAGAVVGLAFFAVAIAIYLRDPVLALIWLWLFEVFNAPLSAAFGYFSTTGEAIRQGDEVLVLLFACLTLWRTMWTDARIPPLRFILPGIGVALFGVLGDVVHNVPLTVSVVGTWLGLKLWAMIVITLLLPWKPSDLTRVYTVITRAGLFVAVLGFADYLSHAAISRALGTSIYSFKSGSFRGEAVHSILPHPGEYSLFMSFLFALTFARFAAKRSRSDLILALVFAGSVMLSLRLKGFLSLVAVAVIVALVEGAASNLRARTIAILLIGPLLIAGVYSLEANVITKQISTYTSSETSARSRLYSTGEQIADDNFPLGVGFGRFASYPSRLYYSPVYSQYRLSHVYGLSREVPDYIDDTSWPSVIGETGYGGLACYVLGLIVVILAIGRRLRTATDAMKWVPLAALCALAVLLVDSLGDATLFNWLATTGFALIFGPTMLATRAAPKAIRQQDARWIGAEVTAPAYAGPDSLQ
jgi:hypothetical protein